MPERKSTRGSKPEKPYSEFPLTANGNGQWSKKIHGRVYYFGVWDDPDAALALYLKQRDYLLAGEVPPTEGGITLGELCNMFMASKEAQLEADEITRRHWVELQKSCQFMLDEFGKSRPVESLTPAHFANLKKVLSKGRNATTVSGHVRRIRSVFNWAASDDAAASCAALRGCRNSNPSRSNSPRTSDCRSIRLKSAAAADGLCAVSCMSTEPTSRPGAASPERDARCAPSAAKSAW